MSSLEIGNTSPLDYSLLHMFFHYFPAIVSIIDVDLVLLVHFLSTWPEKQHAIEISLVDCFVWSFDQASCSLTIAKCRRNFGTNEVILSSESIHEQVLLNFSTDPFIILVETSCVKMFVSIIKGCDQSISIFDMVAAQPNLWNFSSIVQW